MLDYYAHTISKCDNFMLSDVTKLETVLKSGYLLSRKRVGLNEEDALFNGMDYISLCDLGEKHGEYSAYNLYITRGLSLLFDKNIKVVKPQFVSVRHLGLQAIDLMHHYGQIGRYTDLIDEVQAKDEISMDYLRGVSIPLEKMQDLYSSDYIRSYLSVIEHTLHQMNYDVSIYNVDNSQPINVKKLIL